jgi:hypothetical protein
VGSVTQPTRPEPEVRNAMSVGVASAMVPGLGQVMQHRYGTAALQFASVFAYAAAAFRFGSGYWGWGPFAVNIWSVIDAVWWARGSGDDLGAHPYGDS